MSRERRNRTFKVAMGSSGGLAKKKDGIERFCVDYRKLKEIAKKDVYHYHDAKKSWSHWREQRTFNINI